MAWIYQRPDSGRWWVGYRVNGKQVLKSTKETTEAGAKKILAQVEAMFGNHKAGILDQCYAALSGKTRDRRPLVGAVKDWLADCKANGVRPSTLERYGSIIDRFSGAIGATEVLPALADVNTDHVRQFINDRHQLVSTGTRRLEKKVLSVFFEFCRTSDWIQENPVDRVVKGRRDKVGEEGAKRRPFTVEELQLLHTKAPDEFWRFMVVAGFYTGQRMGDLITLRWENVDLPARKIHFVQRKTGSTVHLPMAGNLHSLITQMRKQAKHASGPIWPKQAELYEARGAAAFSPAFYDLLVACGLATPRDNKKHKAGRAGARMVNQVSFHCLRHTFISLLKSTGATQGVSKELAGHNSDLVNDQYTKMPEGSLKTAVDNLPVIDI